VLVSLEAWSDGTARQAGFYAAMSLQPRFPCALEKPPGVLPLAERFCAEMCRLRLCLRVLEE
jgi:hypothetical protein